MAEILIVDDNEMNMRLFSDLLQTKGHHITECLEGTAALDLAKTIKPDLVLMDIQMPKISGLAVIEQIRRTPEIADTPIIAISAFAMKSDEEKIMASGANAYISKPISIPVFFETVEANLPK